MKRRRAAIVGVAEPDVGRTPDLTVTGRVYSYTVVNRAFGEFADQAPFTVALVDLDEGVRMMTRIVDAAPGQVEIGLPVELTVRQLADAELPCFRPARPPARRLDSPPPAGAPQAAVQ